MSYRGHASPGSPGVHELTHLVITKASVGEMDNNAYLLRCRDTGDQLLIDAAAEADVLLEPARRRAALDGGHDPSALGPLGRARRVVKATGATTVAGADDAEGIPVRTDREVGDGDTVTVGSCTLEVIHLVGHTPGSIALLYDDPAGPPHL